MESTDLMVSINQLAQTRLIAGGHSGDHSSRGLSIAAPQSDGTTLKRIERETPSTCFSNIATCMLLRIARIFAVLREALINFLYIESTCS